MSSQARLAGLLSCLLAFAFALPVQADVASPERDRRRAAVAQWHHKHPGTTPAMAIALSPDGKTLAVRFVTRTPASFAVKLNGRKLASAAVEQLKGGVQTAAIPLAGLSGSQGPWVVHADFTLRGVQADGTRLRETGERIGGCLRKRFELVEKGGALGLNELQLDGEDYFILRGCGME